MITLPPHRVEKMKKSEHMLKPTRWGRKKEKGERKKEREKSRLSLCSAGILEATAKMPFDFAYSKGRPHTSRQPFKRFYSWPRCRDSCQPSREQEIERDSQYYTLCVCRSIYIHIYVRKEKKEREKRGASYRLPIKRQTRSTCPSA